MTIITASNNLMKEIEEQIKLGLDLPHEIVVALSNLKKAHLDYEARLNFKSVSATERMLERK